MTEFAQVVLDLEGKLENPGDNLPLQGKLDVASYEVGEKEYRLPEGIDYDIVLTNAGTGILATGLVRAHVVGTCDRCLEDAEFDIAGEIEEFYLFEEPEDPEAYEDGYELVPEDRKLDISGALNDAVVMDTPFVVLCKEDCQGLCPTCGANLNEGPCSCEEEEKTAWVDDPENPFAALKNLKFD